MRGEYLTWWVSRMRFVGVPWLERMMYVIIWWDGAQNCDNNSNNSCSHTWYNFLKIYNVWMHAEWLCRRGFTYFSLDAIVWGPPRCGKHVMRPASLFTFRCSPAWGLLPCLLACSWLCQWDLCLQCAYRYVLSKCTSQKENTGLIMPWVQIPTLYQGLTITYAWLIFSVGLDCWMRHTISFKQCQWSLMFMHAWGTLLAGCRKMRRKK